MEKILDKCKNIAENPHMELAQWKKEHGGKIIGCYPMYVPEEIIHAAGMLPVIVLAQEQSVTQADKYLPPSVCHLVRSTLDLALKGEMSVYDGIIYPDICEAIQLTADIWRIHKPSPFHYNLVVPLNTSLPSGRKYLIDQLIGLKNALEKFFNLKISEEALANSIKVYNQNRELLRRLYEWRRKNPDYFKARDVANIIVAGMFMPKEEHNKLLEQLLDEVAKINVPASGKSKIILSGCLCDPPEDQILDLLDEVGFIVPDDDLYIGSRYFITSVDPKMAPLEGLADRYIADVPCSTKYNPEKNWADYLIGMVKKANADAVLIILLKFCEPHALDYPELKEKLTKAGIPHLLVETEHDKAPLGQLKTRIEALLETL